MLKAPGNNKSEFDRKDKANLKALRQGKAKALVYFHKKYYKEFYSYCYSFLQASPSRHEITEDIIAETFASLFEKLRVDPFYFKGLKINNLKTWIMKCLKNRLISHIRKTNAADKYEGWYKLINGSERSMLSNTLEEESLGQLIQNCISEENFNILKSSMDGFTIKEIASQHRKTEHAIRQRLQRAKRQIFLKLNESDEGCEIIESSDILKQWKRKLIVRSIR